MKLQRMKFSVIACAVYLASVGIESLNMFPSFPTHPCLVHKIYLKKSWDNKYLYAQLIPQRKFVNYLGGGCFKQ